VYYTGCRVLDRHGNEVPQQEEWGRFGIPFNADMLREKSYIPVTSVVNAEMARRVGGFTRHNGTPYDDWGFYIRMLDAGATFHHIPEVTWTWHHHGLNTSGLPDRW
jgi:hypothetical protein